MKIIKRGSVLSILVIISFLFVGCDNKDEELSEFRTYSNDYYTIQYPSNWLETKGDKAIVFSKEDKELILKVRANRSYGKYFEKSLKELKKNMKVEDCIVGRKKGYKVEIEENNKIITVYIAQEKDMFFEIMLECHADDYDNYQSLMDKIKNTFEFNDFATVMELNRSPKVNGDRDAKWLADIEFASKKLPKYHKNLFFKVEEEEFLANVKSIKGKIPILTDNEMIVEVSRLIASVGDSHTSFVFNSQESYPLIFYYFSDGIYLLDSIPEYSEYIGFKLEGINGKGVEKIIELFQPIISHENESWFKRKFAKHIVFIELLNGLKITDSETAKLTFVDKNGNEKSVEVKPSQWGLQNRSTDRSQKMLYLKNSEKNYWYEFLEEEKLLYFKYNYCENMEEKSFSDFNKELFDFIDNTSINKFIIDLRNNVGGSSYILDPFFVELKKRKSLDQPKKLFVIVGRNTYSSAVLNAVKFENETNATFIGEPTGGKPNHYGQVQVMELSNTNTKIGYSTKYFEHSSKDLNSFVPDIIVEPNADDYFNNIDSVMQRILEIN